MHRRQMFFHLTALAVAGALGLACGGGGGAAGASGKLVYGAPDDIHQYDFDAHKDAKLLNGSSPGRFPNGDLVYVYADSISAPYQIVIGDTAGTRRTKVLEPGPAVGDFNPVPSPDGKLIAFTYYPRGFTPKLNATNGTVIMQPDGTIVANLKGVFDPSWTPDGRIVAAGTIAVASDGPTNTPTAAGLYVSNAAFTAMTRLDNGLADPRQVAVSRDGKQLAFVLASHIWTMGLDGTGLRQLTSGDKEESSPAFSPDGDSVACTSFGTFETTFYSALAVVPVAGGPTELRNDASVWPLDDDAQSSSTLGRVNAFRRLTWF
ncbi:MAG: TolB family protein [Hyalangium sp.]|uniref:TolB family protein n=1 Tax=Hyalangium sp. TaxID=2028555 RepID=UPI003899F24F